MPRRLASLLLLSFVLNFGSTVVRAAEEARELEAWKLPYSAGNPPGPAFSDAEKQLQITEGKRLQSAIIAAFHEGRDLFTVPPGNYRFGASWQPSEDSFVLRGLHRPPEKPFRILAHGATFWFNLTEAPAPTAHRMVQIHDCSHLSLEGLVIDSDPRGSMDARITAFDFEKNRIQVEPLQGTRLIPGPPAAEGRFIPFKADGRHLAALYQIDAGWGPGNVFYQSLERTSDGRYWLTMKNEKLLRTIRDESWRKTYGSAGTLEVGDVLGILYSTSQSIHLRDCRQITICGCHVYAAKACLSESGGYGDHRWLDCRFTSRPGSNNLLGGEGTMNSECEHGSTFDGIVVHRTSDDAFNNHGHWRLAESVSGRTVTFTNDPPQALATGGVAEVYDMKKKTFLGTFTVESSAGKSVTFREPLGDGSSDLAVIFPGHQNTGWVIRNSSFVDCYQRVLLQCGPGLFENNRIERCGGPLALSNGVVGHIEGGSPDGVTIRNNVFFDSGISPPGSALKIEGNGRPLKNIRLENNLFCLSGREAVSVRNADGIWLTNNIFLHPFAGAALLPETKASARPAFRLQDVLNERVSGNVVLQPPFPPDGAEAFVRQVMERRDLNASAVIREFRLRNFPSEPAP